MAIRHLALAILALSAAHEVQAQVRHLTPDVANTVLHAAEEARKQWPGAPIQAARAFRMAFWRMNPQASSCFGRLGVSRGRDEPCAFDPISWYAELLSSALRLEGNLEAVKVPDVVAIALVPHGERLDARGEITVSQGEMDWGLHLFSEVRVLTPVRKENVALETLDAAGDPVIRVALAFLFEPNAFDLTMPVRVSWVLDGRAYSHIAPLPRM